MNLQQIIERPRYYKVIDSTHNSNKLTKAMIGGVFERIIYDDQDKTVALWTKDKSDHYWFNLTDVQEVVPDITFNNQPICIGDTVNGGVVYGYCWSDGEWGIGTVRDNDFERGCYIYHYRHIASHTPIHNKKIDLTDEELIEELNRRKGYKITKE